MLNVTVWLRTLALAVALAVAAAPVAFDGCLIACQAAPARSQTSTAVEHSCHLAPGAHAAGAPSRPRDFSSEARPCNHEHGQAASLSETSSKKGPAAQLRMTLIPATGPVAITVSLVEGAHGESPRSWLSLPVRRSTRLALPLRV